MTTRSRANIGDIFGNGRWRRHVRVFLALVCLAALIGLASCALYTRRGQAFDQLGLDLALGTRISTFLTESLTQGPHTVAVLAAGSATAILVAMVRRRFALAARVAVLIVGANASTQILKMWLLDRPYQGVGYELANSFPSGHATVILSLAFALTIVAPQAARSLVGLIMGVVAALAGMVIVAAGWHRPADLVGALLVVMIWSLILSPQEEPQLRTDRLNSVTLTLAIVILILAAAVTFALWDQLALLGDRYTNAVVVPTIANSVGLKLVQVGGLGGWFALVLGGLQAVVSLQTGRRSSLSGQSRPRPTRTLGRSGGQR